MKRVTPTLVLALITAATLVFIYKDKIWPKASTEQAEDAGGGSRRMGGGGGRRARSDPNRIVPILAEPATTANVPVYLNGVGTVQAFNTATVRAQVSGRLIAVNYHEGQDVKKGDVLAQIDPVTYKAAYDQAVAKKAMAEAQLANARLDLKRYEGLAKTDYATKQQADTQSATVAQLEAQVRQDQAAIDSAKANLDYTNIVAPIDGRTSIREVDVGNLVTSGDANGIVVITQIKPVSVLFTLPETVVSELIAAKARGPVALAANVGGETVGEGTLEVIDNRIDQATGTVKLKGTFPNEKLSLWPGQFVNIRLHLKTLENAIVVPAAAVQQGSSGRYVYVVEVREPKAADGAQGDGKAADAKDDKQSDGKEGKNGKSRHSVKLTNVTVTQEDEKRAVIASGIVPGDRVATAGFGSLRDGSRVTLDEDKGGDKGQGDQAQGAQSSQDDKSAERSARRKRREQNSGGAGAGGGANTASDGAASTQGQGGKVQ